MDHNRRYHVTRQDGGGRGSPSNFSTTPDKRQPMRKLITPNSSLEIVDGNEFGASGCDEDRATPDGSLRSWSRSSIGSVPPRSDSSMSRRTMTPTKQVSLQAVRRREESSEPFVDHIEVESARRLDGGVRRAWDMNDDDVDFSKLSIGDYSQSQKNNRFVGDGSSQPSSHAINGHGSQGQTVNMNTDNKLASQTHHNKGGRITGGDGDDDDSDDDDDDDEGDDEDKDVNEKLKAPTELLMEFIDCLMKKDYPNASKLCKMILLYEPENEEALKFQPLIEEKMSLDEEAAAEEDGSGSDDDDDDDDSDDSDDDDDDSSGDDDTSDDENDDDVDAVSHKELPPPPPSSSSSKPNNHQTPGTSGANSNRVWKPAS